MANLMQIMADQIAVTAIGANGRATQLFGQVNYDRKVWVHVPGNGVFISHNPITRTASGFAMPANQAVQFDLPAKCELYAISAAGTVQVSRYSSTVMPTIGEQLVQVLQQLVGRVLPTLTRPR
jgi:hypothetical protein